MKGRDYIIKRKYGRIQRQLAKKLILEEVLGELCKFASEFTRDFMEIYVYASITRKIYSGLIKAIKEGDKR